MTRHDPASPKLERLGQKLERNRGKLKAACGHYRLVTDAAIRAAIAVSGPERSADVFPIIAELVRFDAFAVSSAAGQSHITQAEVRSCHPRRSVLFFSKNPLRRALLPRRLRGA